jgi:GH25 family lysozyme M1 (1,4-beta-N-acetylmuramidase)
MEDAYFWVIENSDGEAIDIIYQHDPNLSDELNELLDDNSWYARAMHTPEPAWEFFHTQNPLRL